MSERRETQRNPKSLATSYHPVLFPIAVVYAPDVLRSGRGGLLADLVRVANRIGKQVAWRHATGSGLREHDDARRRTASVDQSRPRPSIICQSEMIMNCRTESTALYPIAFGDTNRRNVSQREILISMLQACCRARESDNDSIYVYIHLSPIITDGL